MRDQFKEHYRYTDTEIKKLWNEAFFVFDTNTLLNMYRYNRETFEEYVKVLKELSKQKRLFLPNHVGEEFFRNRIGVIQDYKKSYNELLKITSSFKGQLSSKYKHHPFVDIQHLSDDIERALNPTEEKIKTTQETHPDWIQEDNVLEQLTKIFENCTGKPFSDSEKAKIFEEGEVRYEKKIPPGFKDIDKGGERQYGDLVVWKQMLEFARENEKPIVFITGDEKEDWWLLNEGKRLMPLPGLKREMRLFAGVDFHAYTADHFLETYNEKNKSNSINTKAIEEVRRLREIQDHTETDSELYRDPPTFNKESDERYELFAVTVSKFFEIIEHAYDLIPSESYEALQQLESAEKMIQVISRRIRASGKVNNFYLRKIVIFFGKVESILKDQTLQVDDVMMSRQLEQYSIEIRRMRNLLDHGGY